ncbi:MAG: hypothetical protein Q9186_003938 [Xanthomendoza sp. 1 TL-2023]
MANPAPLGHPIKHSGSLMAHLITVKPSQLRWSNPAKNGIMAAEPFQEYSSSNGVWRGFCSACGSAFSWRSEDEGVVELLIGTIDETWLIGDRTEKVSSESLTKSGVFEEVLVGEEGNLGREICTPMGGQMFVRNAIKGVTDGRLAGKRFVEVSPRKMEIPD